MHSMMTKRATNNVVVKETQSGAVVSNSCHEGYNI